MPATSPPALPVVSEPDPPVSAVPEAAVQQAWAQGRFDGSDLRTTDGERVEIIDPGRINLDSGPDVSFAVVRVGKLIWSGDIEIHRTSAEWNAHGHAGDPAYDRVVLHVVLSADRMTGSLRRCDGSRLPEVVLLPHLTVSLATLLRTANAPVDGPPCASGSPLPAPPGGWLEDLGRDRLRSRARALADQFRAVPDLEALLVRRVFRALGYHANADAMETLAGRVELDALRALRTPAAIRDALLVAAGLGADGLFDHRGSAMPRESWRRGGRPANAPRHRIGQAARLLADGRVLARGGLDEVRTFLDRPAPDLIDWLRPGGDDDTPRLGASRARDVVVNALLPVLLLDLDAREHPEPPDRIVALAKGLPAPTDRVVRAYAAAGIGASSALDALGVHALADELCAEGRCARCAIGRRLAPALSRETG